MVSAKWTILTPILVALIPVVAGIVTGIVNAPSPDKPDVTIGKSVSNSLGAIDIKNIGGAPATNITGFVTSLSSPIMAVRQYSAVEITLPEFNNSELASFVSVPINNTDFQFRIAKLNQGEGGFINIEVEFDKQQTADDFDVVAIYDQGSARGKIFDTFLAYFWLNFFIALGLVGETIFLVYFFAMLRRKSYVRSLVNNFLNIRRKLLKNDRNDESFKTDWEMKAPGTPKPKEDKFARTVRLTPRIIKNVNDLMKIDDVLDLISEREDKRNSKEIHNLNNGLLDSINNLLENIDWKKYQ